MTLLVVLILVVLWAAVLGPRIVRRLRNGEPLGSVDTFYHELHLLERAAPKTVAPANRLETAYSGGIAPGSSGYPSVSSMPGCPSLVLLQPVASSGRGGAPASTSDGSAGAGVAAAGSGGPAKPGYRRLALVSEGWSGGSSRPGMRGPRSLAARDHAYRVRRSRHRRRDVLLVLVATAVGTGSLGVLHAFRTLWVFTALSVVLLVVYVLLAVWAQQLATQKATWRREVARTRGPGSVDADRWEAETLDASSVPPGDEAWAARAGYPGAWDDDVAIGSSRGEVDAVYGHALVPPHRVAAGG